MFKSRDLSPDAKLRFPDFSGYFLGADIQYRREPY